MQAGLRDSGLNQSCSVILLVYRQVITTREDRMNKHLIMLLCISFLFPLYSTLAAQKANPAFSRDLQVDIAVNQVEYVPGAAKLCAVKQPGTYYIKAGSSRSYPFRIASDEAGKAPRFAKDDPRIVVALLQLSSHGYDQEANLKKAERYCREAARQGADIALMGEMWNIGYTRYDADVPGAREKFWKRAAATDGPWVQHFAHLAKELRMAIAVAYAQKWRPMPRNAVTIFDREGKEVLTYAKVHTSDFKPLERNMTPGEDFYAAELTTAKGPVRVGAMICFDREQPESARILMLKGAELVLTPNCCGLDEKRIQQFRVRAFENQFGVAMTNYPRPYQNGRSVAFDAGGDCLVEAGEEEGVFYAAFSMQEIRRRRSRSIWGNAYRRPHRYKLLSKPVDDPVWKRIDGNGEPYEPAER